MSHFLVIAACVLAVAAIGTSSASAAGGNPCGDVAAKDDAGDTAKFSVKSYDVGCNRAGTGVKRYFRQTNGEEGKELKIHGYNCGPLQSYKKGGFAFQCRSEKSPAKRYKAFWISKG